MLVKDLINILKPLISKDPKLVEQVTEMLKTMLRNLTLMGFHVDDMLNFAMIKAKKLRFNPADFRLSKVIKFIKETF